MGSRVAVQVAAGLSKPSFLYKYMQRDPCLRKNGKDLWKFYLNKLYKQAQRDIQWVLQCVLLTSEKNNRGYQNGNYYYHSDPNPCTGFDPFQRCNFLIGAVGMVC